MEVPGLVFNNMTHLKEIYLDGNNLMKVPPSIALVGVSLEFLSLTKNPIEIIDDESFLSKFHLKTV